jgi:glucose-1-phosphate adenylyltransferase
VYFGGKFRIVDFALSNCLNSGIRRIGVITQYKSHSLLRHLQRGWAFLKSEMNEFVDLLPAQQRMDEESWYRGTADAVYQNQDILAAYRADYVVVLAGDHIYKMNYALMLADHVALGRDCTVGCIEVPRMEATAFGVMAHRRASAASPTSSRSRPTRRRCPASPTARWPAWASTSSTRATCTASSSATWPTRTRATTSARTSSRKMVRAGRGGGAPVRAELRGQARPAALLARRGHDRRLLGRQHRPHRHRPAAQPVRHRLADLDLPAAAAAGQVRAQPGRPPRHGHRVDGLGRLHRLGQVFRSVLFSQVRVHSFSQVNWSVLLPGVQVGRRALTAWWSTATASSPTAW